MSDWTGTYSTVEAIEAGLDLEMPGPSTMRGPALQRALTAQKLTVEDLDVRVRNVRRSSCTSVPTFQTDAAPAVFQVLKIVQRAQQSGIPFDKPEEAVDTPELRDVRLPSSERRRHITLTNFCLPSDAARPTRRRRCDRPPQKRRLGPPADGRQEAD